MPDIEVRLGFVDQTILWEAVVKKFWMCSLQDKILDTHTPKTPTADARRIGEVMKWVSIYWVLLELNDDLLILPYWDISSRSEFMLE